MRIISKSIHVIDYVSNMIIPRSIPSSFDEYVLELIAHVNGNTSIREYKTRSKYTEVISAVLQILQRADDPETVASGTNSIAKRLLDKEKEAQQRIGMLNTNVQKGSLIQALLYDELTESYSYLLAKVEHGTFVDDIDFSFKTGFSKDKKTIWKSCLINLSAPDADMFSSKIYSNTEAKFWSNDFLEFDEMKSDEVNTDRAFRAIEATLNNNFKGMASKDQIVLRNAFVTYFKTQDYIDYPEMIASIFDNYSPIDVNIAKIQSVKDKLLELPEKKGFDHQFSPVAKVINARIKKIYEVNFGIQLRITDAIEDLPNTIVAYQDREGTRFLKIKTNNDDTFNRFKSSR